MIVETASGRVRGTECGGYLRFSGVPISAPRMGLARWGAPAPTEPWSDVRDALAPALEAPQDGRSFTGAPFREDGLSVGVWTPEVSGRRPVLVRIHGGGFLSGGPERDSFDPARVVIELDCVVVSLTYRLGVLGWLHLDHLDSSLRGSANRGLDDLAWGFAWVRSQIGAFGGDPNRLLIVGESAGAMAASGLVSNPEVTEGVVGVVLLSGAAQANRSLSHSVEVSDQFLDLVGARSVAGLRSLSVEDLIDAQTRLTEARFRRILAGLVDPTMVLGPTVDVGRCVGEPTPGVPDNCLPGGIPVVVSTCENEAPAPPGDRVLRWGRGAIIGTIRQAVGTRERASEVYEMYTSLAASPWEVLEQFNTDRGFRQPAHWLLAGWRSHGSLYSLVYRGTSPDGSGVTGHGSDAALLWSEVSDSLARQVQDGYLQLLGSLLRSESPRWGEEPLPRYWPERASVLVSSASRVECDYQADRRKLYEVLTGKS